MLAASYSIGNYGNFISSETSEVETKVMLNEIHIKGHGMDSDEEGNVDHLSPQTLLETPGENEVQYSLRSPEGTVAF